MTIMVSIMPVTTGLLEIEESDLGMLALALGVAPPPAWPPEFGDESYRNWQRTILERWPNEPEFAGYYLIGGGELVGTCGFKGPPDASGTVEIGYSVIAPRRRRGYASGAVMLLVERAFKDPRVAAIVGETLIDDLASQAVLLRCGFQRVGTRIDDGDGEVAHLVRRRPV